MTLEQREKKARLERLDELRQLREQGTTNFDAYRVSENDPPSRQEAIADVMDLHESDEEFIEYVVKPTERRKPSVFSSTHTGTSTVSKSLDLEELKKDEYFSRLITELDSSESEPEEQARDVNVEEAIGDMHDMRLLTSEPAEPAATHADEDAIEQLPEAGDLSDIPALVMMQLESENWSDASGTEPLQQPSSAALWANAIPMAEKSSEAVSGGLVSGSTKDLVRFYWLDASERPNGTVVLFGKIVDGTGFASCCVTVTNVKRNLFFLPRETLLNTDTEVTLQDVHREITELAGKHSIPRFGCKKVSRKYAFELPGLPVEADYIKMVYDFSAAQLGASTAGVSFSHVFGTGTSALELFLIKRRIMGPCWLLLKPSSMLKKNVPRCKGSFPCRCRGARPSSRSTAQSWSRSLQSSPSRRH